MQPYPNPGMTTLARLQSDAIEIGMAVLEKDSTPQALEHLGRWQTPQAHQVFAFDLAGRMHESMCQLAIVGEQQQTRGIDVEAPDHDPSSAGGRRQPIEYRWPALGIVARGHLADRLVIQQNLDSLAAAAQFQPFPVEADSISVRGAIAERGHLVVDGQATSANPFLDATPRAVTRSGQ